MTRRVRHFPLEIVFDSGLRNVFTGEYHAHNTFTKPGVESKCGIIIFIVLSHVQQWQREDLVSSRVIFARLAAWSNSLINQCCASVLSRALPRTKSFSNELFQFPRLPSADSSPPDSTQSLRNFVWKWILDEIHPETRELRNDEMRALRMRALIDSSFITAGLSKGDRATSQPRAYSFSPETMAVNRTRIETEGDRIFNAEPTARKPRMIN